MTLPHDPSTSPSFTQVTRLEVRRLLKSYGLDLEFPDRFVILQHNTVALARKRPLDLLHHLERLIGTSSMKSTIRDLESQVNRLVDDQCGMQLNIAELNQENRRLLPSVEAFRSHVGKIERLSSLRVDIQRTSVGVCQVRRARLESRIVEEFDVEGMEESYRRLQEEVQKTQEEESKAEEEARSLEEEQNQSECVFDACRQRIAQSKVRLVQLQSKMSKLFEEKSAAKAELTRLHTTVLDRVDQSLEEKERRLRELQTEEGEVEVETDVDVESVERTRSRIREIEFGEELVRLRNMRRVWEESGKRSLERVAALEKSLKKLEASRLESEETLRRSSEEIQRAEAGLQSTETVLAEKKAELETLRSSKKDLSLRLHQLGIQEEGERESQRTQMNRRVPGFVFRFAAACQKVMEPDEVYGPLCEILRISDRRYALPVNTVLRGRLWNTVVCQSRVHALSVVDYFRRNEIGVVTCEILGEMNGNQAAPSTAPPTLTPLSSVVTPVHPKFAPLVARCCSGWFVARDRATAQRESVSRRGTRKNVVTLNGEIFRASGEVSSNPQSGASAQSPIPPMGIHCSSDRSPLQVVLSGPQHQQVSETEAQIRDLGEQLEKVKQSKREIRGAIFVAQKRIHVESRVISRQRQLISKTKRVLELGLKEQAENRAEMARARSRVDTLRMGDGDTRRLGSLEDLLDTLQGQLGRANHRAGEIRELEREIVKLKKKKDDLPSRCEFQEESLSQLRRKMTQTKSKMAVLEEEREARSEKLDEIYEETRSLRKRAAAALKQSKLLQTQNAELRFRLKKLKKSIKKKRKGRVSILSELREVKSKLRSRKKKLEILLAKHGPTDSQDRDRDRESGDRDEDGDEVFVDDGGSSGESESDDDDDLMRDSEDDDVPMRDERSSPRPRRKVDVKSSLAREQELRKKKQELRFEIVALKQEVEESKANLNEADVERHLAILRTLKTLQAKKRATAKSIEDLSVEKDSLTTKRFESFHAACQKVNRHLTDIFKELHSQASGHLHYAESNKTSCFEEGVSYYCKPEGFEWKHFRKLSGGQQAMATCALSLALQTCFPAPVFFYDEIDASLDTLNVEKIVSLLKRKFAPHHQFIVVTLRYQMYSQADRMIGVYVSRDRTSKTVIRDFN